MAEFEPSWPLDARRLRLGDVEIDLRYRTIHRHGAAHELNPRCFELLLLFLREPGVLQTRETIFRKVWSGAVVEDASLTNCIWQMRRAFGDGAKQWIRTVPKQGYVFDPPAPVRAASTDAPPLPTVVDEPAPAVPPVAVTRPRASRGVRTLVAAAAAVVAGVVALGSAALLRADGVARASQRVALIVAADAALPDDARWPAELLHAWLDWQLRSIPNVSLSTTAEACRDCTELAIVLGVELSPRDEGPWRISVRFRGASAPSDVVRTSTADGLVATLDAVGRDALASVAPALSTSAPPLALDATSAAQFANGWIAEQQHRWNEAARAYTAVSERAPAFGYARVRLADVLDELGQQGAAQAELRRAAAWIDALPEPLRAPARARQSLVLQDYANAATAFAALQRRGGDVASYRLDEAYGLRRLGRTRDAAERLAGDTPAAPAIALRRLLQRADVEIANRDLARAATTAREAIDLAGKFGWDREQAQATLLFVQAQAENGQALDAAPLEDAARRYAAAGDKLGALRAHVYAELFVPQGGGEPPHLDELLAEARLAGNAGVEIDALLRTAAYYHGAGDVAQAHERLAQAAAVADSAGSPYERRVIDLAFLHDDTLRLDFDAVDRRIAALRDAPLQGRAAYSVGLNAARLAYLRGRYDAALATLAATEDTLRDGGNLPQVAFVNGCLRASIHLMQGRTSASRNDIRECRASGLPVLNQLADIASAELAIHAGDVAEARRLLAPMRAALAATANRLHRWNLAVEVAPLLARVGELDAARELIDDVLPDVTAAQYGLLTANAHVTRAEIALALGNTGDAERDVATAAALVPADDWYERRRIRTVLALIAQGRGDAAQAATELESLHADAVERGDVLAELLVHSLMDRRALAADCSDRRHGQLLAESGMRGASDIWMNPAAHGAGAALANARTGKP